MLQAHLTLRRVDLASVPFIPFSTSRVFLWLEQGAIDRMDTNSQS